MSTNNIKTNGKSVSGAITVATTPMGEERVIPATKRPDGTLRKERKVRPGFIAQEDVGTFIAPGVAQAMIRQLPPGSVPGKIVREKKKQQQQQQQQQEEGGLNRSVSGIASQSLGGTQSGYGQQQQGQQRLSKKEKQKAKDFIASVLNNQKENQKKNQNVSKQQQPSKPSEEPSTPVTKESLEKKLRNLKKKLGQIEELEKKKQEGLVVDLILEQIEKLNRKQSVLDEMDSLQKQIERLSL